MCVCVCEYASAREGIGLVLFDCVFVFWVKEAGIGFWMSLRILQGGLGCVVDRERERIRV